MSRRVASNQLALFKEETVTDPTTETPREQADKLAKLEVKFERQKKVLQSLTIATLAWGADVGLNAAQVQALREALETLGWLPANLKVGGNEKA